MLILQIALGITLAFVFIAVLVKSAFLVNGYCEHVKQRRRFDIAPKSFFAYVAEEL